MKEFWRAAKFTLFSASAGLIQIGSFTLMNEVMRWPYWVCYLTALVLIRRAAGYEGFDPYFIDYNQPGIDITSEGP